MNVFECICVHKHTWPCIVCVFRLHPQCFIASTAADGGHGEQQQWTGLRVSRLRLQTRRVLWEEKTFWLRKPPQTTQLKLPQVSTKVNTEPNKGPQTGPDEFRSRAGQRVYVCADVSVGLASGMLMTWLCLRSLRIRGRFSSQTNSKSTSWAWSAEACPDS